MRKILLFCCFCLSQVYAQDVPIIKWIQMESLLKDSTDRLHVINFWATWCSPCVKELPIFEQIHHQKSQVHVVLVSLDFPKDYQKKLLPFLERKQIRAKVVLLDESDYNTWIDKVESSWQGEIPFTLIFNHAQNIRHILRGEISEAILSDAIEDLLNTYQK